MQLEGGGFGGLTLLSTAMCACGRDEEVGAEARGITEAFTFWEENEGRTRGEQKLETKVGSEGETGKTVKCIV
jgi:hypothetical protein